MSEFYPANPGDEGKVRNVWAEYMAEFDDRNAEPSEYEHSVESDDLLKLSAKTIFESREVNSNLPSEYYDMLRTAIRDIDSETDEGVNDRKEEG